MRARGPPPAGWPSFPAGRGCSLSPWAESSSRCEFSSSCSNFLLILIFFLSLQDPAARPTARDLLQHSWITYNRRTLKSSWSRTRGLKTRSGGPLAGKRAGREGRSRGGLQAAGGSCPRGAAGQARVQRGLQLLLPALRFDPSSCAASAPPSSPLCAPIHLALCSSRRLAGCRGLHQREHSGRAHTAERRRPRGRHRGRRVRSRLSGKHRLAFVV